ncbi:hypothetical protein A4X06_0g2362 [Tilletia controversa]|uniref:RWD domain-containing protein n=1 Tax=Tilletia controversa TaxID=13291 RepID=A0A8X7MXU3_9BASI|nr:hypothetical protein CF336_g2685 [Tilletia laevis]KAE8252194.1 hypothetical protein A4X06_0g2362 [Tilletia controversa]
MRKPLGRRAHRARLHQGATEAQSASSHLLAQRQPPAAGPSRASHQHQSLQLQLQHLPPLTLTLSLPPTYPLAAPPTIDSLEAPWLPSPSSSDAPSSTSATWIRARLAQMWEESRAEVLWLWADWVREGLWQEISGSGGGGGGGGGKEEGCSWWPPWVCASEREEEGCIDLFEASSPFSASERGEEDCIDLFEGSCPSSSTTPPLAKIWPLLARRRPGRNKAAGLTSR